MASQLISTYYPRLLEAAKTIPPWHAAAGVTVVIVLGGYMWLIAELRSPRRTGASLFKLSGGGIKKHDVAKFMDGYEKSYKTQPDGALTWHHISKEDSVKMVNTFYDLVTDAYEWAWDISFHFSCRPVWANFAQAQVLHECRIANLARIQPGMKVIDVGTGVGNPGRTIASLTGAHVTGVTINAYQIKRALHHTKKAGLLDMYKPVQADFTDMPFADETFDAAFAIEATCHAPKLEQVYAEVYRVLKPGAYFAVYEAVSKPNFDPKNKRHVEIINSLVYGNGIPDMRTWKEAEETGKKVGFKLHFSYDAGEASPVLAPWWERPRNLVNTGVIAYTKFAIRVLDNIGVLPRDYAKFAKCVGDCIPDAVDSGELGIFTPMYVYVWQKPEKTA